LDVFDEVFHNIRNFIATDNPELLIRTAEDIGNYLGMSNVSQAIKIYRCIEPILTQVYRESDDITDLSPIILLKPKIINIVANSGRQGRAALEMLRQALFDGIDIITEVSGPDSIKRLKRFIEFVDSIFSYQQYAKTGGSRKPYNPEVEFLQGKIMKLQTELDKLSQFVSASTDRAKVFLSHAHIDKPFVEKLKKDLEKENITTWYDDKDLNIGDIVSDAISEGIKQSWCFLIVVSPSSIKSGWVKFELDAAYHDHVTKGKKILPVLTGSVSDSEIPERLKMHLFADFRNEKNYEKEFKKLLRAIIKEGASSFN